MPDIDFTHAQTPQNPQQLLANHRETLKKARNGYTDPHCSLALPQDAELFHASFSLAQHYPDVDVLVLIGIGGSNLGAQAVLQAVRGVRYADHAPKILFFDTTDPDDTHDSLRILDEALRAGQRVLATVISKSGGTAETLTNAKAVLALLNKHDQSLAQTVVAITDKDSRLDVFARDNNIPRLHIPALVGGRFSVLSPVGVFPLAVAGIDVQSLLQGAQRAVDDCLEGDDPAAVLAATQHHHATHGKNIVDFFAFAKRLAGVGGWYRQLLAESIGKNSEVGITPTTSIGSTDLHSVAQLYLHGPKDKFFVFATLNERTPVDVPESALDTIAPGMKGVSHNELYDAIYHGTTTAFAKQQLPFATITLKNTTEHELGYLLQTLMLQVMYLGALFDVNAFDQPAVELYKQETRTLLGQ